MSDIDDKIDKYLNESRFSSPMLHYHRGMDKYYVMIKTSSSSKDIVREIESGDSRLQDEIRNIASTVIPNITRDEIRRLGPITTKFGSTSEPKMIYIGIPNEIADK
jgi:hypothetical protein